ncbi:MAG: ABC transporter ATP-binding protein [Gemmatimonadetes bacterium]|nr:ABC transporter ATP-binding protein [Gemmatimonadota bacterium]
MQAEGETTAPVNGPPYVACRNLYKIYKVADLEVVALRGLELEVERAEVIAIVGASGSGKTTLLNILGGYDTPSAGVVRVGDYDLLNMTEREVIEYRRHEVGFIWQQTSRNLFGYLTAAENVELPMLLAGVPGRQRRARAAQLLDLVQLTPRAGHRPMELSGGEQQRAAIAVALANRPPLLLADEPTGELDDETGAQVLTLLNDVNRELGTTIIIVTHDPAISLSVGRAISIRDGKMSSEAVRRVSFERRIGGQVEALDEYVLVDSGGSVQIPPEVLKELSVGQRLRLSVKDGKVILESGE